MSLSGYHPPTNLTSELHRPESQRDCLDCGRPGAMKLQNVTGTTRTNIPLLYVCCDCGTLLTIPPRDSPVIDG